MINSSSVNIGAVPTRYGFPHTSPVEQLTRRQYQILRGLAVGQSNKSIAAELGITENTVSNHLLVIYKILQISEETNQRVMAALVFHRLAGNE